MNLMEIFPYSLKRASVLLFFVVLFIIILPFFIIILDIVKYFLVSSGDAVRVLFNSRVAILLGKSFMIAIIVTVAALLVALPLSYLFEYYEFRNSRFFIILSILPLFIPSYIYSICWIYLLGDQGWINKIIGKIFIFEDPPLTIYGIGGTIFCLTISTYPILMLFISSALRNARDLDDAAFLCSSKIRKFIYITLPMSYSAIISGMIFSFILALLNFSVPGSLQTYVFPVEIFTQFGAFFNHRQAFFLSMPFIIIAVILINAQNRISQKKYSASLYIHSKHQLSASLSNLFQFVLAFFFIIILILPITTLIIKSTNLSVYSSMIVMSWRQILTTMMLGVLGSLLLVTLGFYFAYFAKFLSVTLGLVISLLIFLLFAIPGVTYAVALIQFWNHPLLSGLFYGTIFILILGYFRFLPVSYFLLKTTIEKIPIDIENAAIMAGRSRLSVVLLIIIPMCKKGLHGAFVLSFLFCITELDTSVLLNPPGLETLPVRIFSLLHYGATDMVASLCVINIVIITAILVLGWRWIGEVLNVRN